MTSLIADILGIVSGLIAISSYFKNKQIEKDSRIQININYNTQISSHYSYRSGERFLDDETVLLFWVLFFLLGVYIYKNYRYLIMIVASLFILALTIIVYVFFKSRFCSRPLPRKTFWIYLLSVFLTAASIICTAFVEIPPLGSIGLFHASQILSIIMSTFVITILVWRMLAYSRGKAVDLHRLSVAAVVAFVCFLLASGLLERVSMIFMVDF